MNRRDYISCLILIATLVVAGCDNDANPGASAQNKAIDLRQWQLANAQHAANETTRLVNLTRAFLKDPDAENQRAWREGWLTAHEAWVIPAFLLRPEAKLASDVDAWPVQAGFIDSLPGYPGSGIVNDITLTINSATLNRQHQITDDSEVALGFHVLEYYAFDRDLASFEPADDIANRRITLLQIVADQLLLKLLHYTQALDQDTDDFDLPATYKSLLLHLDNRNQLLFSELNRLGEHGQYSRSSESIITQQLSTMQELIFEVSTLHRYLVEIDPEATKLMGEMLSEAIHIIGNEAELTEAEHSRCLLLVSAVSHTLEELSLH